MSALTKRKLILAVVALIAAKGCGSLGEADYQQAFAEETEYCWRVAEGVHQHWNKDIECPAMPRQVAGVE